MKVAVSIPDATFSDADLLAKQLNISRSALYARALDQYVGRHAGKAITAAMNAVIAEVGDEPDEWTHAAARQVLGRTEW